MEYSEAILIIDRMSLGISVVVIASTIIYIVIKFRS